MNTFQISGTLYTHIDLKFSLSEDTYAHTCAHLSLRHLHIQTCIPWIDPWTLSLGLSPSFILLFPPINSSPSLYTNRPMNMHTHDLHHHGLSLMDSFYPCYTLFSLTLVNSYLKLSLILSTFPFLSHSCIDFHSFAQWIPTFSTFLFLVHSLPYPLKRSHETPFLNCLLLVLNFS